MIIKAEIKGPDGKVERNLDLDKPPAWVLPDSRDLCPACLDTGAIIEKITTASYYAECGKKMPRSRDPDVLVEVVRCCKCAVAKERERRFRAEVEGLRGPLVNARFDGISQGVPWRKRGGAAARKLVDAILSGDDAPGVLILYGESGTGKTYAGVSAVREIIYNDHVAYFRKSCEICDTFREAAMVTEKLNAERERLISGDLLVIDEFGAERLGPDSGVVVEQYERLLLSYEGRGKLIITTNYDDHQAAFNNAFGVEGGQRIGRRFQDARKKVGGLIRYGSDNT